MTEQLALVQHYADREEIDYEVAYERLLDEAGSYDSAYDFLSDIGFERDYLFDARQLMQRAQEH